MYAKYNSFFTGDSCRPVSSTAYTDSTRFSCASVPQIPPSKPKEKCEVQCKIPEPICTYNCEKPPNTSKLPIVEGFTTKLNISQKPKSVSPISTIPQTNLLPVMNPEFNLREICKQIILLEDHLSQPEKRCTDCCIKHFLTIEALSEEAITLDKNNKYSHISFIPPKIRELQKTWYDNPNKNALLVSQQLRNIRKQYMIPSFGIIFTSDSSCNDCTGGVCKIKK